MAIPRARQGWSWLQAAAIVLAGAWAHFPGLPGTWLWDDDQYITRNALLRTPAGLGRIWFAPAGVNYFPLTSTVEWAEWHLWREAPLGYHVVNLALHLLSALLLWRLLRRLGLRLAWLGGLFFAVHPLTVESVAWASELKNTLSLPLVLLALDCYLDFDELRNGGARCPQRAGSAGDVGQRVGDNALHRYGWSVGCFLLAMLAKSTVAMFPFVILLYCWWKRGRIAWSDLGASAAFFAISLGLGGVTLWFEHVRAIGPAAAPAEGLLLRSIAAGQGVIFYLSKCLWPAGLMPIYPRWTVDPPTLPQLLAWPALLVLLGILWTKRATWGRSALFGLGCFLVNLAPVLGLVPMAYLRLAWVADHFAYLPLAGLAILAGLGLDALARRLAPRPRALVAAGAAALGLALAGESRGYGRVFASPEAMWTRTLELNPAAATAWTELALVRYDQGRLGEAIADNRRALRLQPDDEEAHNNLGVALAHAGRADEALDEYRQALRLKPADANARCNFGNALLGAGRPEEAIVQYEEALRLQPDLPEGHYNLGLALRLLGRAREADAQMAAAARLSAAP